MQTFLPYPNFAQSAACLDWQRLGKQRVEAKQIYLALTTPSYGWQNHPAVKMWRHWEISLATYGEIICLEWRKRGYNDTLLPWFQERSALRPDLQPCPPQFDTAFCTSHRSNLLRKLPSHYRPLWPDVPNNLPYIWPVIHSV
jgi:hypothetical protein